MDLLGFQDVDDFRRFLTGLIGTFSITEAELNRYIEGMMSNPARLAFFPYEMTTEKMKRIFELSLQIEK